MLLLSISILSLFYARTFLSRQPPHSIPSLAHLLLIDLHLQHIANVHARVVVRELVLGRGLVAPRLGVAQLEGGRREAQLGGDLGLELRKRRLLSNNLEGVPCLCGGGVEWSVCGVRGVGGGLVALWWWRWGCGVRGGEWWRSYHPNPTKRKTYRRA